MIASAIDLHLDGIAYPSLLALAVTFAPLAVSIFVPSLAIALLSGLVPLDDAAD